MTDVTPAAPKAASSLSAWLRDRAEPSWSLATGHRFTRELADDSLPDAVYRHYLLQDYAFLDTLVRVVAFAIAKAPEMPAQSRLSGFLAAVTSEENDYFLRSFAALGVAESDWRNTPLGPVTSDLRALMLGAAQDGTYEEALAVLLPAEWIYLTWAQAVAEATPQRFYLREWITLHTDPAFAAFVGWLQEETDRRGAELSDEGRARCGALFTRMAELEVAFFDAAYEG